jgi:hypothetical protein
MPATVILAVTLVAAIHPRLQGILITATGIAVFIIAMLLIPRLKRESAPLAALSGTILKGAGPAE